MPLRDHFRPPRDDTRHWAGFHGQWPAMIVLALARQLPPRYFAEPRVYPGGGAEINVGAFYEQDTPAVDQYEVLVFDGKRGCRLVGVVKIVSPANKDRPEHRRAFVAKCAALLQNRVCVAIVDVVTTRHLNLYRDLVELIGETDPTLTPHPPSLYAVACRWARTNGVGHFDVWGHSLVLGEPLPTLPLWLDEELVVPLDLEGTYEETCRILRIS